MIAWEREARARWVAWHRAFAQSNGGQDWRDWAWRYDAIEEEWENYRAVFEWCAAQGGPYHAQLNMLWRSDHLAEFANIYGHWTDRLTWLGWRIQHAKQAGLVEDWAEAAAARAYTLIHMAGTQGLAQARQTLEEAWQGGHNASLRARCELANTLAMLYLSPELQDYAESYRWLGIHESLLTQPGADHQLGRELDRQRINLLYYEGILLFKTDRMEDAEARFTQVRRMGDAIGWQRAGVYARNWLADILLKVKGDPITIEALLNESFDTRECRRDRRRYAHYQSSFAMLAYQRGNYASARSWAERARRGFASMNMRNELDEMQRLLARLP